ncbi:MAG: hypothetical protein AW10_03701 [Candidatus Accumulibacter appositus]|uniref:Uncharacterized protein n=1 Tax=Candidatus Accumulibacter appositus TaxID=1454003 RepID=A0A011PKG5_9PROT|nr:MAG: hypothetical protein AW10_03701 [Candidatus Accumulibacter appositus]
MPSAVDIVAQTDRLPSLPAAYLEVKRVIDDTNGSIRQLAAAMSSDAAMARCAEEGPLLSALPASSEAAARFPAPKTCQCPG